MSEAIFAKEYEEYLVTKNEASLSTLIPGSLEYQYFQLSKRITNDTFTDELKEDINTFICSFPQADTFRLKCFSLLKEFEGKEENKTDLIKRLSEMFSIAYIPNYSKPQIHFSQGTAQISSKLPSVLDSKFLNEEEKILSIYNGTLDPVNQHIQSTFTNIDLITFDIDKISEDLLIKCIINKANYSCFIKALMINFKYFPLKSIKSKFDSIIKKIDAKYHQDLYAFLNGSNHYFTYEQIEYFITLKDTFNVDNFIYELIYRKYGSHQNEKEEKIRILKEILEIIKTAPLKFFKIRQNALLNILALQSQLNIYNKDLFIDFLKEKDYVNAQPANNKLTGPNYLLDCYLKNYSNESEIISKYLFHFFYTDNSPYDAFSKYFSPEVLKDIYHKAKVYRGDNDAINKEIEGEKLAQLISETSLKICNYNKTKFTIEDKIELSLEIKNIKTLFVKIYQINTLNYYYTNKKTIQSNSTLSVDGITPTYEDVYTFDEKPQVLLVRKFAFDKIPLQRGIYIIEFIGNGVASRAIIKKGGLSLIHRDTLDGKVFYILNEQNEICKGDTTGIWMKEQFFKGIDSGEILIPYQNVGSYQNLIYSYENFAEFTSVYIPNENYTLKGTWIYNKETLIMGNVCKFLVRPYLFVNNQLTDIGLLLKKVKIEVVMEKEENGQSLLNIIPFENIVLNSYQEYQFEFQIPPKIVKIAMKLTGEVKAKSNDMTFALAIEESIQIDSKAIESIFLTKKDDDYLVEVRGKNGELIPGYHINFNFSHRTLVSSQINLETDENGKVNLGKLKDVKSVKINQITYNLNENTITYNKRMLLVEGDQLKLPIYKTNHATLLKLIGDTLNINITDKIKFCYTDDSKTHGYITVDNLTEGKYRISLPGYNEQEIIIEVIKGKYWADNNFILTDKEIINSSKAVIPIAIEKFDYKSQEKKIELKINKASSDSRVHIQAYQFYLNKNDAICDEMTKCMKENKCAEEKFKLIQWNNIFLNNKILSDEIQYVLDRKQYERTLGNSLEKPSLIMKRQFIRDTNTSIKTANEGSTFSQHNAMECDSMGRGPSNYNQYGQASNALVSSNIHLSNFILKAPLIENNLIPNESGVIVLPCDLSEYSFVHVICVDDKTCCEETIDLNQQSSKTRDLRMTSNLLLDKHYTELKKVHYLSKDAEYTIPDITSVKYKVFDSIEKYWKYLDMACNNNANLKDQLNKFNFLINFELLNLNEKTEKISEFFSHEFNVFMYFHHSHIFKEFIYPILRYKIEKSFIDFFLMDDMESIMTFTTPEMINNLNSFEKCLLIYAIRKTHGDLAKNIANTIKVNAKKNKLSDREIKQLFNMALNVNIIEEEEEEEKEKVILCSNEKKMENKMPMAKMLCGGPLKCAPQMAMARCGVMKQGLFGSSMPNSAQVNLQNNLFSESGKAKEYCETQYYSYSNREIYNSKNAVNDEYFFADLADYWASNPTSINNKGFHSDSFLIKPTTLTQMLFALSALDLESQTPQQKYIKNEGLGLTIKATSNAYILTKEINETTIKENSHNELMIAQIIHYDQQSSQDKDEAEPKTFLSNVVYNQTILITNISNKLINCDILFQVPEGAIPVGNDDYTTIQTSSISKFNSQIYNQRFYFPQIGTFKQYPASASINDVVVVKGPIATYPVVKTLPKITTPNSFSDVLEQGSKEEILNFIKKTDVIKDNEISKIYWLLKDKEFYSSLIEILRNKMCFDNIVWTHAVYHNDITAIKEFITYKCKNYLKTLGHSFDWIFAKCDLTNNAHLMNHKDYYPILNSRVHKLSKAKSSILTVEFRQTYYQFISYLMTLKDIDSETNMRFCYYLILQEKIELAQKIYERIDCSKFNDKSSLQLQYDYLTAYLDFSNGYPKFTKAREICIKYKEFPLIQWRDMFMEINDQLLEFDGIEKYDDMDALLEEQNEDSLKKLNKMKGEKEEKMSIAIKENNIDLVYSNISSVTVKYYLIDIEILFSRNPFMKKDMNDFSYVVPNEIVKVELENNSKEKSLLIPITKEYTNKNIYIEVSTEKTKLYETYYSSLMQCSITESIGEVKVLSPELKPMPKVYVKCFAELSSGSVEFYKDGYTDLRGRFNYVSLNSDLLSKVKKFSILIVCDQYGSIIRKCNPPKIIFDQDDVNKNNGIQNIVTTYEGFQNYRQEMKQKVQQMKKK